MERRLVSVVLMESTGRKGFQGKLNGPHLVLINSVFLFPAGKTLLKKGTSLTFLEYFLNQFFCKYFALISITSWEYCKISWLTKLLLIFTNLGQNFIYIWCRILGRKSSFLCIFLLVTLNHEYAVVSGGPPALLWRACASPPLDPATFASKGTPDTSKTGGVLCELGPKRETPWIGTS